MEKSFSLFIQLSSVSFFIIATILACLAVGSDRFQELIHKYSVSSNPLSIWGLFQISIILSVIPFGFVFILHLFKWNLDSINKVFFWYDLVQLFIFSATFVAYTKLHEEELQASQILSS